MATFAVGRTYFQLTYADVDLTMPGVDPRVFLGEATLEDGSQVLVFQDTVSYVMHGSRLELPEETEDIAVHFVPMSESSSILDIEAVAAALATAARRAKELNYPALKVVGTRGWSSK
jgi:hypothetical protein